MKRLIRCGALLSLLLLLTTGRAANTATQPQTDNPLIDRFLTPPAEARAWCFWYWMYGALSTEGITADLEAMRDAGLKGAYLMPIKSPVAEHTPAYDQLSPEWFDKVGHAVREADRLGLELGFHICDGFALAGGPWIRPEESMQKIVWSDTTVCGRKIRDLRLPEPEKFEGYYEDIALYAVPVTDTTVRSTDVAVEVTSDAATEAIDFLTAPEGSGRKGTFKSRTACSIVYRFEEPFLCRSIWLMPGGRNLQACRMRVEISPDGENYETVKQLEPARQGWQNFDYGVTYSLPATRSQYFRFSWDPEGSEPGSEDLDAAKWSPSLSIKRLVLSNRACTEQIEGKSGLVWRVAPRADRAEEIVPAASVIDLTQAVQNGLLNVTLPRKGVWRIIRMGHTATGQTNATGGGGRGLECDKFNRAAIRKQLDGWFERIYRSVDPATAKRVITRMHVDSWECGSQNWSKEFAREFAARRGYDLLPWLPVVAGVTVESPARTEAVLHDLRQTIAELVADIFYDELNKSAVRHGCLLSAECTAPTMVGDGLLHYGRTDLPMGEFWLNSPTHDKPNDMLDAVHGAHIYGKRIIQAEGFTELRTTFDEYPAQLKQLLDRNFAAGFNRLFFHVYVHNPYMDKRPGMTLDGIGLYFQRNQTWWPMSRAWTDYIARCQALLQYGEPVVDLAVFSGDELPRRAILPDRLVASLPGIFGERRVAEERERLANAGVPLRTKPVGVKHTANMADPEDWVNALNGYAYDTFNPEVLARAVCRDGQMVLPSGAAYPIVVVPLAHPMAPDGSVSDPKSQAAIEALRQAGCRVIDESRLPYREADFTSLEVAPDLLVEAGDPRTVAWTHRRGDAGDLYFVANQTDREEVYELSFRAADERPLLLDPVTGGAKRAIRCAVHEGRTCLTVRLAAGESFFALLNPTDRVEVAMEPLTVKQKPFQSTGWHIHFAENGRTVDGELFDWRTSTDPAIRYYSGVARYTTTFTTYLPEEGERVYLAFPPICGMARVYVNGRECGTLWTAPWRVEVTGLLFEGENWLEIEVANTWLNALRGADAGEPPYAGIWTNAKYHRMTGDGLAESGLLSAPEIFIVK